MPNTRDLCAVFMCSPGRTRQGLDVNDRTGAGTIRSATLADAGMLAALSSAAGLDVPFDASDLAGYLERGRLIVLDVGNGVLGAIAYVSLHGAERDLHARIELLAIHPALAGTATEDAMAAAVLAICESSGCADIDVAPTITHRSA